MHGGAAVTLHTTSHSAKQVAALGDAEIRGAQLQVAATGDF